MGVNIMRGIKHIGLFALMLIIMTVFTAVGTNAVSAYSFSSSATPFAKIDVVYIGGHQVLGGNSLIRLERGETVDLEVLVSGLPNGKCRVRTSNNDNPCNDVYVEAEIDGYEYGLIGDVDGPLEIEPNAQSRARLRFTLPDDIQASDDLTLNIQVKDDDDVVVEGFKVRMQEQRHAIDVFGVIFNPFNNVRAGQPLFASVRIENLGDNRESNIRVTAAIPSLNLQTGEWVDKLLTFDDDFDAEDADEAETTNDLRLDIPMDAKTGDYNVVIRVDYDNGRTVEEKVFPIHVIGSTQTSTTGSQTTVVNVDAQAQKVETGKGAVYKFSIANLNSQASTYTFEVLGTSDWANVRTEPSTLIVQPDRTADAFVFVAPREDATGLKSFTVRVKSDNNVVAEKNLSLEVAGNSNGNVKTVFTWIFIVLLLVLVVLIIVVIVRNLTGKNEGQGSEGQ